MIKLQSLRFFPIQPKRKDSVRLAGWRSICAVLAFCAAMAAALPAQTFDTLLSFDGSNGVTPNGLVQGADGALYGTTIGGGANGQGTVFRITTAGAVTTLYSFCSQPNCDDGQLPRAGLMLATDGNFYGTTTFGGTGETGTVFKITPSGTLTTLHSFVYPEGSYPYAGLLEANGNFYGTTAGGSKNGYGTVFEITPAGVLTTLYPFCSLPNCADGEDPYAGLIQAANGNFYGTAEYGGTSNAGTVFELSPSGAFTAVYSFCALRNCFDGERPDGGVIQAANGNIYGTTGEGGAKGWGTVFEIDPAGTLTTVGGFDGTDGASSHYSLVQGTNGNFFGVTADGGLYGEGNVFEMTSVGGPATLYSFCSVTNCPDGQQPSAALIQATDGNFYGTASAGGAYTGGTVFSLSVGLGPFVETLPTVGMVGEQVVILGTDLAGATSVSFNGTAAVFTVKSGTEITTSVPAGATTGKLEVTTPGRTLESNLAFRIRP
jgi:uncharacterized repeat protein (TIGR03803 family)